MALRADDVDLKRDRALVEGFQAGDQLAFDDLYRRYFARVYRFCLRRVGDRHEAEELTQEAFARAYRALPSLQGERRFYPWISVIAQRLCLDSHRRRSRMEVSDTIDLGAVDGDQERIVDASDAQLLNLAFDRLAASHREVLKLREQEGWSYQRIAEFLGVTLGTVEARLFRARQALRREFAAIAGPDSGLAALPVVGWLLRRLGGMRARAADWASLGNLAPAIGGAVAAATLVIGSGVALNSVSHQNSPVAGAHLVSPAAAGAAAGASAGLQPSTLTSPAGPTTGLATGAPSRHGGLAAPVPGNTAHNWSETQQKAAGSPVAAQTPLAGGVAAGANPTNAILDAQDNVDAYLQQQVVKRAGQ